MVRRSGLEVIKLEYSLRLKIKRNGFAACGLKIKRNDWLLADVQTHVRKQPIIALYFESENELKCMDIYGKYATYHLKPLIIFFKIWNLHFKVSIPGLPSRGTTIYMG